MSENGSVSNSIKDILDEISKENEENKISSPNSENKKAALVFDDTPVSEEEPAPRVEFEVVRESEKPKEFSVPERYVSEVAPKETKKPDVAPRVAATYVPRFTEVSEQYRYASSMKSAFVRVDTKKKNPPESAAEDEKIDPTSELDEASSVSAVEVSVGKMQNEELTTATKVFKFAENEPPREQQISIPAATTTETLEEPSEPSDENTDESREPKDYRIPDPVDREMSLTETTGASIVVKTTVEEAGIDMGDDVGREQSAKKREYKSRPERDAFKDNFLDSIMSVRVRFFASLAVSLLLLFVETLFAFGTNIPRILNMVDVPGAMALLDLQFVIALYLLALPETVRAVRSLLGKRVTPEIFLSVSFAAIILYTVLISISSPARYALFGLIFAILAISSIGATYYRMSADFTSFKLVSKNGEKQVIDNKYTRTLERENAALDGIVEEHKSKTARVFRTLFVPDFFARSARCSESSFGVLVLLGISLGVSLVTAVISFFIPGGLENAITAFTLVLMLSYPAMSILVHKVPYFYASREADKEKSAIIGEKTLFDYSGIDVVTFEDTEVFGQEDVTLQRIMLYGRSDNLTKALRQMSALFMNVGGPLDVLFSDALDRKCSPAKLLSVDEGGLVGEIDGHSVTAGTFEFMRAKGITLPSEDGGKDSPSDSTKVMYASEDGEVYAKFYIRYSFSEEFSMLLPTLDDAGIKCLVYTRDPNVTDELIMSLTAGADKIRVLKKYDKISPDTALYRQIGAGIVITGDKTDAINMILLSKRYAEFQLRLSKIELIAMLVGGALGVVLSIGGMSLVPTFALALWQTIWCGALHIISKKSFRIKE